MGVGWFFNIFVLKKVFWGGKKNFLGLLINGGK